MSKVIYRVTDSKGKYQQSYSDNLPDSYKWATDCAEATNGQVHKAIVNEKGETQSTSVVFPEIGK